MANIEAVPSFPPVLEQILGRRPLRPWTQALHRNKCWSASLPKTDPDLLSENSAGQQPGILFIGCSDSRVPETTITKSRPGDIFVHRNIANIIQPGGGGDQNVTAVITYAINVLKVKDIVVCGHILCGGIHAALDNEVVGGVLDSWLLPLRGLRAELAANFPAWSGLTDEEKERKLVEENVRAGMRTLLRNADVIRAMEGDDDLLAPPPPHPHSHSHSHSLSPTAEMSVQVHGAVYDIEKGELYEIFVSESAEERSNRLDAFKTS